MQFILIILRLVHIVAGAFWAGSALIEAAHGNYFDQRDREAVKRRSVQRLERLGYKVELVPIPAAAA